jgi:hypothetical protein
MDLIKIDDPRLDESFSFLFAFKKGDIVSRRNDPTSRGEIRDGIYIGELPKRAAGTIKARGKTLYEITLSDESVHIVDEAEIQKIVG